MKGKIVRYNKEKGFGFIKEPSGQERFFHIKDFETKDDIEIESGQSVVFEYGSNKQGIVAKDVKLIQEDKLFESESGYQETVIQPSSPEPAIQPIKNNKTKIVILGKTGTGKSSICNALIGSNDCETNSILSCTEKLHIIDWECEDGINVQLFDVPGFGASEDKDKEYEAIYKSAVQEADIIFLVLKADDRTFSADIKMYHDFIKDFVYKGMPFFILVNQVDKIEPYREWDTANQRPGLQQLQNLELKNEEICRILQLPYSKIIPVSATENYNISRIKKEIGFIILTQKECNQNQPVDVIGEKELDLEIVTAETKNQGQPDTGVFNIFGKKYKFNK